MILISVRKDFTSGSAFSDDLQFREIAQGKLEPFTTLTELEFRQRAANRKCLLLVHGYRNKADAAAKAYFELENMLRGSNLVPGGFGFDEVLGFLWPGGLTRAAFFLSIFKANKAGKRFEKLLLMMAEAGCITDVQTHSLGARVVLEALDRGHTQVRNLHLTAAAVDDESIEQGQDYVEAAQACQHLYVFHSKKDSVLKLGYRFGDLPEFDRALGWKGPQHPEKILASSKVVDCQDVVNEHGGYRDAPEYFDYWRNEMQNPPGSAQFVRLQRSR